MWFSAGYDHNHCFLSFESSEQALLVSARMVRMTGIEPARAYELAPKVLSLVRLPKFHHIRIVKKKCSLGELTRLSNLFVQLPLSANKSSGFMRPSSNDLRGFYLHPDPSSPYRAVLTGAKR